MSFDVSAICNYGTAIMFAARLGVSCAVTFDFGGLCCMALGPYQASHHENIPSESLSSLVVFVLVTPMRQTLCVFLVRLSVSSHMITNDSFVSLRLTA